MKFTKNWKRFWTLDRHHAEGFTLVELIVVIAILAILAGVAVPAYSGYVEKANRAGDEQLLSIINRAFASACVESGVDILTLNSSTADIEILQDGTISIQTMEPAACREPFGTYYTDNEDSKFTVFTDIYYSSAKLGFTENYEVEYTYGGGVVRLSAEDIEKLAGSTFLSAETLGGSAGLLDKVNSVTEMAAGMAGKLDAVFKDPTFTQVAMKALGVTTQDEYTAKQNELIAALMKNNPGMTTQQAIDQLSANAAVLYAANSAVNFTDEQLKGLFSTTGVDTIKENLKGANTTEGMAQAALVYGMYTAYANSEEYGNATLQGNTENALAVLEALEKDPNFKAYINSNQGQTDLDAYLGALGMINDSATSNPTAVEHLMVNGFNNADLKDVLAGATGK